MKRRETAESERERARCGRVVQAREEWTEYLATVRAFFICAFELDAMVSGACPVCVAYCSHIIMCSSARHAKLHGSGDVSTPTIERLRSPPS